MVLTQRRRGRRGLVFVGFVEGKESGIRNPEIEVTSWLVSADDFSSRVARGANERVSAATPRNE